MNRKNTLIALLSMLALTKGAVAGPLFAKAPPAQPLLPSVSASNGGWYGGISGGYLWLNDATSCGCVDLRYDAGWAVNGVVGYEFAGGFSLGLTAGYLHGEYDLVSGGHVGGSADANIVPVMLSAGYKFDLTNSLLMYLGAGVGTAWSEVKGTGDDDSSGWTFAWQGRAGFGYKVSNETSLNLGWRYINVADGLGEFGDARGHMAEAGLKVRF